MARLKNRAEVLETLEIVRKCFKSLSYGANRDYYTTVGLQHTEALMETFNREKKKPKGGCKG